MKLIDNGIVVEEALTRIYVPDQEISEIVSYLLEEVKILRSYESPLVLLAIKGDCTIEHNNPEQEYDIIPITGNIYDISGTWSNLSERTPTHHISTSVMEGKTTYNEFAGPKGTNTLNVWHTLEKYITIHPEMKEEIFELSSKYAEDIRNLS